MYELMRFARSMLILDEYIQQSLNLYQLGGLYMLRPIRSIKVCDDHIDDVKQQTQYKYVTQKRLAEDLGLALSTVNLYLNGKPIYLNNFMEISEALNLDWKDIACLPDNTEFDLNQLSSSPRNPLTEKCFQTLSKPGALLRIKAPRKRGKTTLALEVLSHLRREKDYRTVYLSLDLATSSDYQNINSFLRWFCLAIGDELNISSQLSYSLNNSVSKVQCSNYIKRNCLMTDDRPLVLCIDRLDQVFSHPAIAKDFFGFLRSRHEKAKEKEIWQLLKLVILHRTEDYGDIDPQESPFNIGTIETPTEFTAEQTSMLAEHHRLNWSSDNTRQLMDVVGGHPYLIDEMLSNWQNCSRTLDQQLKLEADPTSDEIYSNYLEMLWKAVNEDPDLVTALKKILDYHMPVAIDSASLTRRLIDIGLIVRTNDGIQVQPYCQLFRDYFQARINRIGKK